MENKTRETETVINSKFTNWLPFINNTQNELNYLENLGSKAYLDYGLINTFYARFRAYMSTRWSYVDVDNRKTHKDKLDLIGKKIFSPEYLKELSLSKNKSNYNNPKFISAQANILNDLLNILDLICVDFRKRDLLYNPSEEEKETIKEEYKGAAV